MKEGHHLAFLIVCVVLAVMRSEEFERDEHQGHGLV
jgi:hypothetical protein